MKYGGRFLFPESVFSNRSNFSKVWRNEPASVSLFLLALLLLLPTALAEDAPPFPLGESSQEYAGLRFHLEIPDDFKADKKYSLLVALHGMGASETSYASWFVPLLYRDFIICAPKSKGAGWSKPDIAAVRRIVAHLTEKLPIAKDRIHAAGFSNGGAHLPFLVFEGDVPFATVCFMGSGFGGGKVPASAKKMAALALAGTLDPMATAAKRTPKMLKGKVRRADVRLQEDLAHEIPEELMPFYFHWLTVMEGRFFPGEDDSFPWTDDLEIALEELKEEPRPSFFYFFNDQDTEKAAARHVQNEVLLDPLVYEQAKTFHPVKLDIDLAGDYFHSLDLTRTPAIVVFDAERKVVKRFEGDIDATDLAATLRAVARKRPRSR